jgi:hypothetical protein
MSVPACQCLRFISAQTRYPSPFPRIRELRFPKVAQFEKKKKSRHFLVILLEMRGAL